MSLNSSISLSFGVNLIFSGFLHTLYLYTLDINCILSIEMLLFYKSPVCFLTSTEFFLEEMSDGTIHKVQSKTVTFD